MKKIILSTFFAFIFALAFAATSVAANADGINVTVDGQQVDFAGQGPAIVDGRTLVPVRGVFETLGFNVDWDGDARAAILTRRGMEVVIPIDDNIFTINGMNYFSDVPAQIMGGSTMLPIRALLEGVGYEVGWDNAARTVVITSVNISDYGRQVAAEFLSQMVPIFSDQTAYIYWRTNEEQPELQGFFYADGSRAGEAPYISYFLDVDAPWLATGFQLVDLEGSGIPDILIQWDNFAANGRRPFSLFRYVDGQYLEMTTDLAVQDFGLYRDAEGRIVIRHGHWSEPSISFITFPGEAVNLEHIATWDGYGGEPPEFYNTLSPIPRLRWLEEELREIIVQNL